MSIIITNGGYDGASDIITSVANTEIIPQPIHTISDLGYPQVNSPYTKSAYTNVTYFVQFNFYNKDAIHVKVNGERIIYLDANENFQVDKGDPSIFSFIVLDDGKNYHWNGIYA